MILGLLNITSYIWFLSIINLLVAFVLGYKAIKNKDMQKYFVRKQDIVGIIIALTMDSATGEVLAGPDIISRGFVYVRESEDLMDGGVFEPKLIDSELAKIREMQNIWTNGIKQLRQKYN